MLISKQVMSVPIDNLIIPPKARLPFIVSSFFPTALIGTTAYSHDVNTQIDFEMPFVYKDGNSYHAFANWSVLLSEKTVDKMEINVCLYPNRPKDIEKIAWAYIWHIYFRSIHPDSAIDCVYRLCSQCPDKYRMRLLHTGKTKEPKAILEKHLGLGRQRARAAEQRRRQELFQRWGK
jgi:hypothetical protein